MAHYPDDIIAIVTINENDTFLKAVDKGIPSFLYKSDDQLLADLAPYEPYQLGLLAWWPKIISKSILNIPNLGFINTHPSLLPFNRGKHYNFWAIVEQCPFGVSLHYVDEGIDSGDIIAQKAIPYNWEDNGETLYTKASTSIFDLFIKSYPELRLNRLKSIKQDLSKGSLHYANEIDLASKIDLDKKYLARDLINLLRARTFNGHPGCWFESDGVKYEIKITINRENNDAP